MRDRFKRGIGIPLAMCMVAGVMFFGKGFDAVAAKVPFVNSGSVYRVRNVNSGKYLDVKGAVAASGTNVQLWSLNTLNAMKWQFIYLSNGFYVLRSELNRNNALCVQNNYNSNSSNVYVRNIGSSNSVNSIPEEAQWFFLENYDGTYTIIAKRSGSPTKVLDPQGAGTADRTNVIQYQYSGGSNSNGPGHHQKWVVEEIAATTYQLSWYLVDSGKHLDWKGSSKYINEFKKAVSVWNEYKPGVIREDAWNTINDLTISDVQSTTSSTIALTRATGEMIFYINKMDSLSKEEKLSTSIHELGHALGLDHSSKNGNPDIMREYLVCFTSLSRNDKYNYFYLL